MVGKGQSYEQLFSSYLVSYYMFQHFTFEHNQSVAVSPSSDVSVNRSSHFFPFKLSCCAPHLDPQNLPEPPHLTPWQVSPPRRVYTQRAWGDLSRGFVTFHAQI